MKIEMPDGKEYDGHDNLPDEAFVSPIKQATRNMTLTNGQYRASEATRAAQARPGRQLLAVVGYAGTGKTTLIRTLADSLGTPLVCAPTGKAALRVQEATGLDACTIHRWLYTPGIDKYGHLSFIARPMDELWIPSSKLVIIDEASMVQLTAWTDLWKAAEYHQLKVIAIGDGFQLSPVKEKDATNFSLLNPYHIKSMGGEVIELTEIVRQAMDSPVIRASMKLRQGSESATAALRELPQIEPKDLLDISLETRKSGGVIICHTNVTRHKINAAMRQLYGGETAQPGEPLLVLQNNYDVELYNGEQVEFEDWWVDQPGSSTHIVDKWSGEVADVDYRAARVNGYDVLLCCQELEGALKKIGTMAIAKGAENYARANDLYKDGALMPHLHANFGYCYTAHKSQGSEWPFALIMVEPTIKLQTEDGRRWAYTAITRAKEMAAIYQGRI
jgi:ATP-dependent exoDNAse (exonuclease V) alpha subunit